MGPVFLSLIQFDEGREDTTFCLVGQCSSINFSAPNCFHGRVKRQLSVRSDDHFLVILGLATG